MKIYMRLLPLISAITMLLALSACSTKGPNRASSQDYSWSSAQSWGTNGK